MPAPFPHPPRIVVLTGAGLAREAGFAPFAPEAMPPGLGLADVVTPEGFARDPAAVHDFYNRRRRELHAVRPSLAHQGLAALDLSRTGDVLIVTRTIDDLHERAGAQAVIHTHGELLKARCRICTRVSDWFDDLSDADACPICGNHGHLRPNVVWVGEMPQRVDTVMIALATCATYVAIGDNGGEPARSFLAAARHAGADLIEFAAAPTPVSPDFPECRHGPLSESVPEWVKQVIGGG